MVRRAVGTLVPWLGVSFVVWSCVEQSDAPPLGTAGKGGRAVGGGAGRAQSGSGGDALDGNGASDAAAGAGAGTGGTGGFGRAGGAGQPGRAGSTGHLGSSGSASGGAGQTSGPGDVGRCDAPEVWSANLVGCEGDYVHRPAALACELPPRNGEAGSAGAGPLNFAGSCSTDADCNLRAGGYCIEELADSPQCAYGCRQDRDCNADELCACVQGKRAGTADTIGLGVCVAADCRIDADCNAPSLCVAGLGSICRQGPERWPLHFHCQSQADECNGARDCGEGGQGDSLTEARCNYSASAQHFVCGGQPGC